MASGTGGDFSQELTASSKKSNLHSCRGGRAARHRVRHRSPLSVNRETPPPHSPCTSSYKVQMHTQNRSI